MVEQKLNAESVIVGSSTPYTIFCPTWPMEQLPRFIVGGTALVVSDALPPLHWFAASDLAQMVSRAYQTEEAAGRRLVIHGPEALTMVQALDAYRSALHPEIATVTVLPTEAARAQAAASDNKMLAMMADMMAYFDAAGELGDPEEANALLGGATTTLGQWISQRSASAAGQSTSVDTAAT